MKGFEYAVQFGSLPMLRRSFINVGKRAVFEPLLSLEDCHITSGFHFFGFRKVVSLASSPNLEDHVSIFISPRDRMVQLYRQTPDSIFVAFCNSQHTQLYYWGRSSSAGRQKYFFFSKSSKPDLGPTQPPIQWISGTLYTGVKRPGREEDYSLPTSVEVKETWIYTSTPPYVFMA
jgi:hypothetical protein